MKQFTILILLNLILALCVDGQGKINVTPVQGVNSSADDIVCGLMGTSLIVSSNERQDLVNDYQWNEHHIFQMKRFERGTDLSSFSAKQKLLPYNSTRDEGTACYTEADSTLFFSSAENYGDAKGAHLKIYKTKWRGSEWSEPQLLSFCDAGYDYAHPAYDTESGLMFFSSNRPGGRGGMDLWYVYKSGKTWTEPSNPGLMVNSTGHEIFPSFFKGDIYFASNGIVKGVGYDLYRAVGKDQWKVSIQLPDPFNGPYNDTRIVYLSKSKGFITSDRPGALGGDDVFLFADEGERQVAGNGYSAELLHNGNTVPGAAIRVTNDLEEIVLQGPLDEAGRISLESLALNRKYKLVVSGISPSMFGNCVLNIMDSKGNIIRELYLNAKGMAELELLSFNYTDLPLKANVDKSILTIDFKGQVYTENPGDLGEGELITILDEEGETVAVAYTNESGAFQFSNLFPELNYRFHLTDKSRAGHVVVFDQGKSITLPVLKEEAMYNRIRKEEAIQLVNELNETIYISPSDIFVINRIYYSSNSAELTEEARTQLDHLVEVLRNNPELGAELRAHTDSRGNATANLELSASRANAALEYLALHGIDAKRIKAQGLGEKMLMNKCADGVVCSDNEHAINRRTDIRLFTR